MRLEVLKLEVLELEVLELEVLKHEYDRGVCMCGGRKQEYEYGYIVGWATLGQYMVLGDWENSRD